MAPHVAVSTYRINLADAIRPRRSGLTRRCVCGEITENRCRPERRSGSRVLAVHDRGHVVAACIEADDGLAIPIDDARIGVSSQSHGADRFSRPDGECIIRRGKDAAETRIWLLVGVPVKPFEIRFALVKIGVDACPGKPVESMNR
jgi:hypothetical protein